MNLTNQLSTRSGSPGTSIWDKFNVPVPMVNTGEYNHGVDYVWNNYGYRTHQFDQLAPEYILTAGCSLTEGIGLPVHERWSDRVEQQLSIQTINLAKGAANAEFVKHVVTSWVHNQQIKPKFAIVQWPTAWRMSVYDYDSMHFLVSQNDNQLFTTVLKYSTMTFVDRWITSVIETNRWLQYHNIPCYNMMLYTTDEIDKTGQISTLLEKQHITALWDNVENNESPYWLNRPEYAKDNLHPGPGCNQQWANQIINIINKS